MTVTPVNFNDGAGYEQMMGRWSRLAGEAFLDWLEPAPGLRWLDVGCGNGAFTELVVDRCAPAAVEGIDPSEGQLAFARTRPAARLAQFREGGAESLPYEDGAFDIAVMALAINQIPDPAKAVAEMARVVRPGSWVASYMWDLMGGGFTMEPIRRALGELGVPTPIYGAEVTQLERMRGLWEGAGLREIAVRRIDIELSFVDFDEFWDANTRTPNSVSNAIGTLSSTEIVRLKAKLQALLPIDPTGRITHGAHANAVKGRVG